MNLRIGPSTKRGILATVSALFDLLGFLGPFTVTAKLLLQELWRLGCQWDEEIAELLKKSWERWLAGAQKVSKIRLTRQYLEDRQNVSSIQLHIFCDASEAAYGCVGYLRYIFKAGGCACAFVMSKSRVVPIKSITLPRLELNAAVIGARLSRLIVHEIDLPVETVKYWSDSTLVLQYIHNKRLRLKVFTSNRTSEIHRLTEEKDWGHIDGGDNPADILSRGVYDPEELLKRD